MTTVLFFFKFMINSVREVTRRGMHEVNFKSGGGFGDLRT